MLINRLLFNFRPQDADNKTPDATILSMRQQAIAVEFFIHNASILFEQSPSNIFL